MKILAIDPGTTHSGVVEIETAATFREWRIFGRDMGNLELLEWMYGHAEHHAGFYCAIEMIQSQGMAVGQETFGTCVWIGRLVEAWLHPERNTNWDEIDAPALINRMEVKMTLCGHPRAKDPNIRVALLDKFGPGKSLAIGLKASRGPLYGISGHMWQALAVGVTFFEKAHTVRFQQIELT
jgi:hypothetical protein